MAWCHQPSSYYVIQCWPRSMSLYGITRPQWVANLIALWLTWQLDSFNRWQAIAWTSDCIVHLWIYASSGFNRLTFVFMQFLHNYMCLPNITIAISTFVLVSNGENEETQCCQQQQTCFSTRFRQLPRNLPSFYLIDDFFKICSKIVLVLNLFWMLVLWSKSLVVISSNECFFWGNILLFLYIWSKTISAFQEASNDM